MSNLESFKKLILNARYLGKLMGEFGARNYRKVPNNIFDLYPFDIELYFSALKMSVIHWRIENWELKQQLHGLPIKIPLVSYHSPYISSMCQIQIIHIFSLEIFAFCKIHKCSSQQASAAKNQFHHQIDWEFILSEYLILQTYMIWCRKRIMQRQGILDMDLFINFFGESGKCQHWQSNKSNK